MVLCALEEQRSAWTCVVARGAKCVIFGRLFQIHIFLFVGTIQQNPMHFIWIKFERLPSQRQLSVLSIQAILNCKCLWNSAGCACSWFAWLADTTAPHLANIIWDGQYQPSYNLYVSRFTFLISLFVNINTKRSIPLKTEVLGGMPCI